MIINEQLEKFKMTKYRLSKESSVPQPTINDICSGKAKLEKCSASTLYKIAKVLKLSIKSILESEKESERSLKELSKEFRKLNGKTVTADVVLIGGASVAINYGFRNMESENKDILLNFQDEYPSVTNGDNINDIIAAIRKKKESKTEN